ncbi:MAG: CotH kinase family protein [Verrucomicrobiota bacterium]
MRSIIAGIVVGGWIASGLSPLRAQAASLCINEIVSANDSGRLDEDGDHSDWIELFNAGNATLNLGGWGLSDDSTAPFKWIFPTRILNANAWMLVTASGKNRTNTANLHANFNIRSEGERLFLTRPDGVRVDEFPAVNLPRDFSFGRQPDGGTNLVYFSVPTPIAANIQTGFPALASAPVFSRAGGFSATGFDLVLSTPDPGSTIRYTLNGSEPTTNSAAFGPALVIRDRSGDANSLSMISGTATVNQHTDGWFPPNGVVNKATTVRARTFRSGAWPSPIITQSYLVFTNAPQRYVLPVLSLAINTNDLFNYTTGIYVLGKVFTDYTNAHPGEYLTGHTPANYTQRGEFWERRAHLEYFEPGGGLAFEQNVAVDIQGQSSRSFREKSVGLKARSDVAPTDTFAYEFWPGLTNRAGKAISGFSNFRLSNSGNDWSETLFRDALCHRICAPTGIDTLAHRPMVVFLDGEYWGVHDAREQLDPRYFENHYGVPHDEVVICEGDGSLVDGLPRDEQNYLRMRSFIETNDMTVATNYAWVRTQMDVADFIAYQASEIYIANADWPHNNIRYWRKRTAQFETNAPAGHDGRWRWAMFDTDLGYAHPWSGGYSDSTLAAALNPNGRPGINAPWSTLLLRRLMTNADFRREFINTYADHLNSTFKESRTGDVVNQIQATMAPSMPEQIKRWRTMGDSMTTWSNNVQLMRTFASQRTIICRQQVVAQFGLAGYATLTLDVSDTNRGQVRINTLLINRDTPGVTNGAPYPWRGTYFRGVPVELEARPAPGFVFAGWSNRPDLGLQQTITVDVSSNVTWTALFERSAPHDLAAGPYIFKEWSADASAGSYPAHLRFAQTATPDPTLATPLESDWQLPYNLTNRSRINGLGEGGIAFLNTSSVQDAAGAGYLGSAVLALRTTGVTNIEVSWVGGTVTPNQQVYSLRLQFAVGDAAFQDVPGPNGQPVEYVRHAAVGHAEVIDPVTLPASANDQPYVLLRWKYYLASASSGSRAQLRLDDILVRTTSPTVAAVFTGATVVGGSFPALQFPFIGSPHGTYTLEVSTDLAAWLPVRVISTDIDGRYIFTEPMDATAPTRYYRLRQ